MITVGLTGGIASGKSVAAQYLQSSFSVEHIDADVITHELLSGDADVQKSIRDAYGVRVFRDGAVDRQRLGSLVFSSEAHRQTLEEILHPKIGQRIQALTDLACKAGESALLVSIALLLEKSMQEQFDEVLVILADRHLQQQRLCSNRKMAEPIAKQRLQAQWTNQKRQSVEGVHFIWNNHGLEAFQSALGAWWEKIVLGKGLK